MHQRQPSTLATILLAGLCASAAALAQTAAAPSTADLEAAFKRADTNADGKLSRDEAARLPEVAAKFDQFDADKDGMLTWAEFSAPRPAG